MTTKLQELASKIYDEEIGFQSSISDANASFVTSLAPGFDQYRINFPEDFDSPPSVTLSLQSDLGQIIPYTISGISPSDYYINFGMAIPDSSYSVHTSAQVTGVSNDSSRNIEVSLIANWLEGHIGELNNLIFTSFSGYNPENFNLEEQSILRELYLSEYNRKSHRRVLRGIDGSDGNPDFQVIREGDSMIQRSNKNTTAKSYHDAYLASQDRVKDLVFAYNLYSAKPSQVYGKDAPS